MQINFLGFAKKVYFGAKLDLSHYQHFFHFFVLGLHVIDENEIYARGAFSAVEIAAVPREESALGGGFVDEMPRNVGDAHVAARFKTRNVDVAIIIGTHGIWINNDVVEVVGRFLSVGDV